MIANGGVPSTETKRQLEVHQRGVAGAGAGAEHGEMGEIVGMHGRILEAPTKDKAGQPPAPANDEVDETKDNKDSSNSFFRKTKRSNTGGTGEGLGINEGGALHNHYIVQRPP